MPDMHSVSSPASPREPCTPSLAVNRHPCEIRFQNLSFHVPHKGDGGLPILNGVTGVCRASKMVAVMGPSGAGKSTLVCLASLLGLDKKCTFCKLSVVLRSGLFLCIVGILEVAAASSKPAAMTNRAACEMSTVQWASCRTASSSILG